MRKHVYSKGETTFTIVVLILFNLFMVFMGVCAYKGW